MKRSIGEMIYKLRNAAGISQKELASGLLSIAELSRVEKGEREEDKFILEALFQRLGKSADEFEFILSKEEYHVLLLKNLIIRNLMDMNLSTVAVMLLEYHEMSLGKRNICEQFFYQMRSVNYYLADRNREDLIKNLLYALEITMPEIKWKQKKWERMYLCTQEIQLLLMLGCVWMENDEHHEALLLLENLLEYVYKNVTDAAERTKVYPKCAWLLGEIYYKQGKIKKAYKTCERGKECLSENGALIVMDKLLSLEEICLRQLGLESERRVVQNQLSAVKDLYRLADYKLPKERILCLLMTSEHNEVVISNAMVREMRLSYGLSQEKLCEDICSRETLSKIESMRRSPNRKNLQAILKKMGEARECFYSFVVADDYEIYEKVRIYKRSRYKGEVEKTEMLLNEIEKGLDMNNPVNRQFVESNRLTARVKRNEISYKKAISELEKMLKYTMKNFKGDIYRVPYREEFIILNNLALYNRFSGDMENAERLYEQILKKYEESVTEEMNHDISLFLLYINYTGLLEVMDKIDDAEKIGKRGLYFMAECQSGETAAIHLGNISCIYDKKNTLKDNELCEMCMRQSYWLQMLYHLEEDSQIIKEVYKNKYSKELV